ncbi:hypothetical protein CBM2585_A210048 [Cupriavidus taiwanensis]|nr:hypothetical protein CBM2585_A210048 [Cupriavidus taiwanensis]
MCQLVRAPTEARAGQQYCCETFANPHRRAATLAQRGANTPPANGRQLLRSKKQGGAPVVSLPAPVPPRIVGRALLPSRGCLRTKPGRQPQATLRGRSATVSQPPRPPRPFAQTGPPRSCNGM